MSSGGLSAPHTPTKAWSSLRSGALPNASGPLTGARSLERHPLQRPRRLMTAGGGWWRPPLRRQCHQPLIGQTASDSQCPSHRGLRVSPQVTARTHESSTWVTARMTPEPAARCAGLRGQQDAHAPSSARRAGLRLSRLFGESPSTLWIDVAGSAARWPWRRRVGGLTPFRSAPLSDAFSGEPCAAVASRAPAAARMSGHTNGAWHHIEQQPWTKAGGVGFGASGRGPGVIASVRCSDPGER